MQAPDRNDMQGMLRYGYGRQKDAWYVFLTIKDATLCKQWLAQTTFQSAAKSPSESCMNLAFSAKALQRLGIHDLEETGFSRAFIEGMDTDHRNRTLGDVGINAPEQWEWGNRKDEHLHVLLMIFARNLDELTQLYEQEAERFKQYGMLEHHKIHAAYIQNPEGHYMEHFGFRDGLSQPEMHGTGRVAHADHMLNPGEFVLGYPNAYDKLPHSPHWMTREGGIDLGRNGSYMVFRQLEQYVSVFWSSLHHQFKEDPTYERTIELAAKMVGRWPNGDPLVPFDTEAKRALNAFRFHEEDPKGYHCPFGSHIRRTNPRDSQSSSSKEKSIDAAIEVANRHRILRRGRPYGTPIIESMDVKEIIRACLMGRISGNRGLNFICFNTDIDRQFEFVQHTWSNNPKFAGLYDDVDPIVGVQAEEGEVKPGQFEVPAKPVRKRYKDLPLFTRMKGGSYFFLPGIQTIQFLSTLSSS
ncbi:MAG: Dyp-type peroxidase [Bacteroidota bacterium]